MIVGTEPWLPWPLCRWRWWTEPVRAERLAALRIGIGLCLTIDILTTYLPAVGVFFGADSMGAPELTAYYRKPPHWRWSLVAFAESHEALRCAMVIWALAAAGLTIGLFTRLCAV